jgi:PTS system nitrogen regulatory IIA component
MEIGLAMTSEHNVVQWLQPQDIVLDVDVWDRRGALELAATRIGQANGLDPAPILRALWRREQVGSTAIGQGVAVPHARISGITRPLTLFMRPKIAMEFDAPDGKPVSNLLVIMVPADGDTNDHLQLLALVARAFSDPGFRSRLSAASSTAEVAAVFEHWAKQRPA